MRWPQRPFAIRYGAKSMFSMPPATATSRPPSRISCAADTIACPPQREACHCLAVRQEARHVAHFFDRFLASSGLRTTQFSILGKLKQGGSQPIARLAADLVMDRTPLGRNIRPLERAGLVRVAPGRDRRRRELHLTAAGVAALRAGAAGWREAQRQFEHTVGHQATAELRVLLHAVAPADL